MRYLLALIFVSAVSFAVPAQDSVLAIRGGKIFTLAGEPIDNGTVLIKSGRIVAVGKDIAIPTGAKIVDASGLQVYPGFFSTLADFGLYEVWDDRMNNDMAVGQFTPQLVASTAINTALEQYTINRAQGFTHAMSTPVPSFTGGIGGQASLINLDGWTVDEMLVRRSIAMVMALPMLVMTEYDPVTYAPYERPFDVVIKEYDDKIKQLDQWLDAAERYNATPHQPPTNPYEIKLDALGAVVRREIPLTIVAETARDIRNAIGFSDRYHIRIIISGGSEAPQLGEELAKRKIPVVLRGTQYIHHPGTNLNDQDHPYDSGRDIPSLLYRAGVLFTITSGGAGDANHLAYEAGAAVAFGLPHDAGLKSLTLYPAQIFGVDKDLGTLEPGKIANIQITDGDPLEVLTHVKHLIINGREVSLENKQSRLYAKYRERPRPTK